MKNNELEEWLKLSDETKNNIFSETANSFGLPSAAVEKDWWVVQTLALVFNTAIAPYTVFKGGTSLSKAWNLIERFSEDIDLALDRSFLGFDKEMTKTQVKKLREKSFAYISESFFPEIKQQFDEAGLHDVVIKIGEVRDNEQDPLIIEIFYPTVTEKIDYILPRVLIEIGSRSLIEPYTVKSFSSMVGEKYMERNFADKPINIPTVNPERTFLEKVFLLHEEFQKPVQQIKIERRSRHLYDLEKLMDTNIATNALQNKELYLTIVAHRKIMNTIRGIDYSNHIPISINPIPPIEMIGEWEKDYKAMQVSMFYNESSIPFNELINRISILKDRINQLNFEWKN